MISNDHSPLPNTDVHYLQSQHVGDEFKVLVGHHGSAGVAPAHVLFMGDPSMNFGTAVETSRLLHFTGDLPPLLIVAVGYRTVIDEEIFTQRYRDFTPTIDPDCGSPETAEMGGADKFLSFFRDELKPWVRETYGVDPDDSAFFGDSLGGLFATYVLLTEPTTFRRYGIGSPSYWWGQGTMFETEAEFARINDDLPAKVFVSVGALETPEGDVRWRAQLPPDKQAKAEAEAANDAEVYRSVSMVADAERMVETLRSRAYPGLDIEYQLLADEYHQSSPPLNLSRSLRHLFGAPL